jgi:hypothetical protein
MGVRSITINLLIEDTPYELQVFADLDGWFLVEKVKRPPPYLNYDYTNMDEVSLWKELQGNGISAGLHRIGWIGVRVDKLHGVNEKLKRVKISVERSGSSNLYKFVFREWQESPHDVLSKGMMDYRFG